MPVDQLQGKYQALRSNGPIPLLHPNAQMSLPEFHKEAFLAAIENVVDLASNYHFSMLAKNAKDMAAAAVLVISGYAVLTGLIIFVPKIIALIFGE